MNTTATATRTATAHACACSTVTAFAETGELLTTGCTATTKRTFAPGHDARLKGFLIRVGAQGIMATVNGSGMNTSAEGIAARFGFAHMVTAGIENAARREFARELRKTAKKAAPAVPATVTAKVGRWTYEGVVLAAGDGTPVFRYTNKKGETVDAPKFSRV